MSTATKCWNRSFTQNKEQDPAIPSIQNVYVIKYQNRLLLKTDAKCLFDSQIEPHIRFNIKLNRFHLFNFAVFSFFSQIDDDNSDDGKGNIECNFISVVLCLSLWAIGSKMCMAKKWKIYSFQCNQSVCIGFFFFFFLLRFLYSWLSA